MPADDEIFEISVIFMCAAFPVFAVIEEIDDIISEVLAVDVCVVSGLAALFAFIDNNGTDRVPEFLHELTPKNNCDDHIASSLLLVRALMSNGKLHFILVLCYAIRDLGPRNQHLTDLSS